MFTCFQKGFIGLIIFFSCNTAFAQSDSIDVFVKSQMQKRRIPGLQLAIVRHGKIIKTANFGYANLQDSMPVTDKTAFTINSITKAFVGVAILQLVEAGKLNLSSTVSTYLTNLPGTWKSITIQQLLSHTSGIPDIVDEEESVMIAPTAEEAWKKVIAMPIHFQPGEKFSYNQTNYLLLGQIIDTLTGGPFQSFITKEQLQKVGMTKTIRSGFGATKDVIPHAADSYQYRQGKLNNMFFSFPPFLQSAAGMSSTANEMADWIIALQDMQLVRNKSTLTALWAPGILTNGKTSGFSNMLNGYAAGWPVVARAEHKAVAPVGGGRSALFVYPDDDLTIVVLTNLSGGNPDAFIDEIAGFYFPDMKEVNGFGLSPSLKILRARLEKSGYTKATDEVKKIRKTDKDFTLLEDEINGWGYKLIKQNKLKEALEIFKLNVVLYPTSANAFDSLGEMYEVLGDNVLAIKNYEQSLLLNSKNRNAEQRIKELRLNK